MLGDLAARLSRRGIRVSVGHRGRLALAAAHAGKAVVVETDDALARLSLRESLRLRPDVLRRLGWHHLRVHSFELFGNPDAVAARVARLLGRPVPSVLADAAAARPCPRTRVSASSAPVAGLAGRSSRPHPAPTPRPRCPSSTPTTLPRPSAEPRHPTTNASRETDRR